jgi:hypothetical protein
MNVWTKSFANIPAPMVIAVALAFGLFCSAQSTTLLSSLSSPRVCTFANPGLGLTRHAAKEVSPPKPELPLAPAVVTQSPPGTETPKTRRLPVLSAAILSPESARIQHRRIPARSPDDPAS